MTAPAPHSSDPLLYGKAFADALHVRLKEHFQSLDKQAHERQTPLTIGLFGGWGSGKTLHLQHLRDLVRAEGLAEKPGAAVTLPILFNAWRHESEDHLIVPLLKTTQYVLERWLKEQQPPDKNKVDERVDKLWETATNLKDAALALGAGLKGKWKVPFFGELEVDPSAMLEEDARRRAARGSAPRKTGLFTRLLGRKPDTALLDKINKLDNIYHDFEHHLLTLTGVDNEKGTRLNLLFLIDDLDRCLPEKAVQMLESIKLFLDVPGCAFVLALDDEVVERGIAHRYRDYRQEEPAWDSIAYSLSPRRYEQYQAERDHQAVGPANPVSGHEYLEKMVHLPLYVPRPGPAEVRGYLRKRFPALFEPLPEQAEVADSDMRREKSEAPQRNRNAEENAAREKLLVLIERTIPRNPRKLNRLAELYIFALNVAAGNEWNIETARERLTLMRLCAVQLLAPDLYRFGQHQATFFAKLELWLLKEGDKARTSGHLEQVNRNLREKFKEAPRDLRQLERLDEPLLAHLRNAQNQRSRFDPLDLFDPAEPCDEQLRDYYRLTRAPSGMAAAPATARTAKAATATLANPSLFMDQLLSSDPLAWRNALAQEADALAGRVLDEATFAELLEGVSHNPDHVSVAWLTPLAPHLTQEQMLKLYREDNLLQRLNAAIDLENPQ